MGYLKGPDGESSSSRLNSTFVIWFSMFTSAFSIAATALKSPDDLVLVLPAAGAFFASTAGPAMYFMFNQKKTEESA